MNQHAVINSFYMFIRTLSQSTKKRHLWKIWRSCQNTVELMFWQLIIQSCFVKKNLSSWFCCRVLFEALGRQRNTIWVPLFPRNTLLYCSVLVHWCIEEPLHLHWPQCITYTQLVPTLTNVRSHRNTGSGLLLPLIRLLHLLLCTAAVSHQVFLQQTSSWLEVIHNTRTLLKLMWICLAFGAPQKSRCTAAGSEKLVD